MKAGTRTKATRVKGGEVWRNKMSKKIRSVVWLVNLMNIKSIQKLLFGLNVDKRHGDKRGKERFCILSQNLKSQKIFSKMKKNLLKLVYKAGLLCKSKFNHSSHYQAHFKTSYPGLLTPSRLSF